LLYCLLLILVFHEASYYLFMPTLENFLTEKNDK
jgi:hypothetical protein